MGTVPFYQRDDEGVKLLWEAKRMDLYTLREEFQGNFMRLAGGGLRSVGDILFFFFFLFRFHLDSQQLSGSFVNLSE